MEIHPDVLLRCRLCALGDCVLEQAVRDFLSKIQPVIDKTGNKLHLDIDDVVKFAIKSFGDASIEVSFWKQVQTKMKENTDRINAGHQAWDDWRDSLVTKKP